MLLKGLMPRNLALWVVEKYHKEPLPDSISPYDLLTGTMDMMQNVLMALKYNMRHGKYEDMYNRELIEEPECLDPNDEHREFDSDRILYVVGLSNCMVCKHSRVKLFSFGYTIRSCVHILENCNSLHLTDFWCMGGHSKGFEIEALERLGTK